jgi:hypothetical protein
LEASFAPEIVEISNNFTGGRAAYLAEMKSFYNGHRFSKSPLTVYNPFGLLHHFSNGGEFVSYWFQSGTPTFLLKLINEQKIDALDLEGLRVTDADFQKYDLETLRAAPVLYQSGCLMIVDYDEGEYQLDYPKYRSADVVRQVVNRRILARRRRKSERVFLTLLARVSRRSPAIGAGGIASADCGDSL